MHDPIEMKSWPYLNRTAERIYGMMPKAVQEKMAEAAGKIPIGPPRNEDSGDFRELPSRFSAGALANFARRFLGTPAQRADAWLEFGTLLNRRGWRLSDLAYTQAYAILEANGLLPDRSRNRNVKLFESQHFRVKTAGGLLVDRRDGGHLIIEPLQTTFDVMSLSAEQMAEYLPIIMAAGRAMTEVMNESGIAVERINFMDMGNWALLKPDRKPRLHMHLFGRARGSRFQIHGEFSHLPPQGSQLYPLLQPLEQTEIAKLQERIPVYYAENLARMATAANAVAAANLSLLHSVGLR